jgi:uncharacterized protein YceH (UPF0502 family)
MIDDATATTDEATNDGPVLPLLSPNEARILGCLIEKQATTPETYPLTLNATVLACNQKTSREPIMNLDPGEVAHTLRELENRGLVASNYAARAARYEHRFDATYHVTPEQRALLAVLLLRGPQTINELLTRTERLARFASADDVRYALERLATRLPAKTVCLGRAPGQREDRYMHLLCGPVDASGYAPSTGEEFDGGPRGPSRGELEQRVAALEARVAELEKRWAELGGA